MKTATQAQAMHIMCALQIAQQVTQHVAQQPQALFSNITWDKCEFDDDAEVVVYQTLRTLQLLTQQRNVRVTMQAMKALYEAAIAVQNSTVLL